MMHVAQVRQNRNTYMVLIVEPGRKRLVRRFCCKEILLLHSISKRVGGCGLGSSDSVLCQSAVGCKHDSEPSSYIKCRKFLWLGEEVFAFQGHYTIQSAYFRDLEVHRRLHTWMA
jgi:hypothetical protein